MTTQAPLILAALENGILRLVLNRPDTRNALSSTLLTQLQAALDDVPAPARAIILAASGQAFSVGHDLHELRDHRGDTDRGEAAFTAQFTQIAQLARSIVDHPLPVIAEVQGMATGAACLLIASCDLVVASDNANFSTPEIDVGLLSAMPMAALSRNMPDKALMHMLLTGEVITADEAMALGLINRVVGERFLTETAMGLAAKIVVRPQATVKAVKATLRHQREMPLSAALDHAVAAMTKSALAAEAEEGINAFLDKRDPAWPER